MWQPIETAPKDGTRFVALCGKRPVICQSGQHYVKWPHQEGGPTFRDVWDEVERDSIVPCNPDHWMPLPPPPTEGGE